MEQVNIRLLQEAAQTTQLKIITGMVYFFAALRRPKSLCWPSKTMKLLGLTVNEISVDSLLKENYQGQA